MQTESTETETVSPLVQDAERYRFLRDNPLQLRAIDGNANICGAIKAESVDQWTDIAMLDAARAHPPTKETDADA